MKNSPRKVIELCVYIALIIAVIIWLVVTGDNLNPFMTDTRRILIESRLLK